MITGNLMLLTDAVKGYQRQGTALQMIKDRFTLKRWVPRGQTLITNIYRNLSGDGDPVNDFTIQVITSDHQQVFGHFNKKIMSWKSCCVTRLFYIVEQSSTSWLKVVNGRECETFSSTNYSLRSTTRHGSSAKLHKKFDTLFIGVD